MKLLSTKKAAFQAIHFGDKKSLESFDAAANDPCRERLIIFFSFGGSIQESGSSMGGGVFG